MPLIAWLLLGAAASGGGLYWYLNKPTPIPTPGQFAALVPGKLYRVLCMPGPQILTALTLPMMQGNFTNELGAQGFTVQLVTPVTNQGGPAYVCFGTFKGGQSAFANTGNVTVLGVQAVGA